MTVAGGVKVLDFGTARANFAEREAKTMALAFGSQGYMAPERMLGEEDTPAADIFSLGITLYELLTLESFGRIPPRRNKFHKKMDERVASVPLEGDEEWVQQVRETLRLMLSYAPADRPTAAQLVEIMDLLAQEANDTGLRRYCRTLVQEAQGALPPLDTGDPLTGTIVEEDNSGASSIAPSTVDLSDDPPPADPSGTNAALPRQQLAASGEVSGLRQQTFSPKAAPPTVIQQHDPSGPSTIDQATTGQASDRSAARGRSLATGTSAPVAPPPPAPKDVKTVVPGLVNNGAGSATSAAVGGGTSLQPRAVAQQSQHPPADPVVEAEVVATVPPPAEPGSNLVPILAALVGLLVVGLFLFFGAGALGLISITAIFYTAPVDTDGPVGTDGLPPPPEPALEGSRIVSPDGRADAATVPTVLKYGAEGGAAIEIIGPGGFRAEWDGKELFDLGKAGEGAYKANVTPPGGQKLRLKKFSVDGTKGAWLLHLRARSGGVARRLQVIPGR